VLLEEAPTKTLYEMLLKTLNGPGTKSAIYKKATIRKLIKDVAAGLKYLHSKEIGHGHLEPENIYMFKTPGAGAGEKYTAKLADFGLAHRFKSIDPVKFMRSVSMGLPTGQQPDGAPNAAETKDTKEFVVESLSRIVGVLLVKAKKHTKAENPCTQDLIGKDVWVKEVCEIVTNLARIYKNIPVALPWTSEDLANDAWVNATD